MNWFQRFFGNPNVHAIGAAAASVASIAFPQYAIPIAAVGALAGVTAAAIPEHPVAVPMPSATPIALPASGSLHGQDYAAIVAAVLSALQKPPEPAVVVAK